jgi:hypothetical protein
MRYNSTRTNDVSVWYWNLSPAEQEFTITVNVKEYRTQEIFNYYTRFKKEFYYGGDNNNANIYDNNYVDDDDDDNNNNNACETTE